MSEGSRHINGVYHVDYMISLIGQTNLWLVGVVIGMERLKLF